MISIKRWVPVCTGAFWAMLLMGCSQALQSTVPASVWSVHSGACVQAGRERADWAALDKELRVLGLALQSRCQGSGSPSVAQLQVLDASLASQVLRGPLADGEPVDLGATSAVRGANDVSPDVLYNREWLRAALRRHHLTAPTAGEQKFAAH
ncbi:MAG: hypothetical protein M9919_02060 [Burkholderiaceae bacterium]|nr:hypothetical protein [Burkholderiaceae bacterium]MCO5102768.1 hypothetical protein [Burkholderiaceae bacterium]